MRDFIRVYYDWLVAIGYDSNFEHFIVWLWTLTESQLDEVERKYDPTDRKSLASIDSNYEAYDLKMKEIVRSIRNCRAEYSLLYNAELASPLYEVDYVKALMDVHFGTKHWEDLDAKQLERATTFYNDFDRYDGAIIGLFWNDSIAQQCKDILAEKFLLKNEV